MDKWTITDMETLQIKDESGTVIAKAYSIDAARRIVEAINKQLKETI